MQEQVAQRLWRKAISQQRDGVQSRALVWVMSPLLVALCALDSATLHHGGCSDAAPGIYLGAIAISVGFALLVWLVRAGTLGAAGVGAMACFCLTMESAHCTASPLRSGLVPLIALVALTWAATRVGRAAKERAGVAEARRGRRASQVLANLGIAAVTATGIGEHFAKGLGTSSEWLAVIPLAALVESTADTVSSELGQVFGGRPWMVTTLRRVEVGTDGAVSLAGTALGLAAGAVVAGLGGWALELSPLAVAAAMSAGVVGLFVDSLLGATVERRGWLGNDLVNLTSTAAAAAVAATLARILGR